MFVEFFVLAGPVFFVAVYYMKGYEEISKLVGGMLKYLRDMSKRKWTSGSVV